MSEFTTFTAFHKSVNLAYSTLSRACKKLRDSGILQEGVDWKLEDGILYVDASRFFVELVKHRPDAKWVNPPESTVDSGAAKRCDQFGGCR
jgi:hypothetical protein